MRRIFISSLAVAAACGVRLAPSPAPRLAHPRTPAASDDTIGVTWIGHATVLLRLGDRWILTDPVFSPRIEHVYAREVAPGIDPRELPPLDAILVSHSHVDHLDPRSLRRPELAGVPVVVPPG